MILKLLEKVNAWIIRFLSFIFFPSVLGKDIKMAKHALVICHMGIGNLILFLPLLKNLRLLKPDLKITVYANKLVLAEIIERHIPICNIIVKDIGKEGIKNRIQFYFSQRSKKYDLFICNFLGVKKHSVLLALFCQIPFRIGHTFKGTERNNKFDFFFNYAVDIRNKHELDFNLELLSFFGLKLKINKTFFDFKDCELQRAKSFLDKYEYKNKVVLQTFSSFGAYKNWPYYLLLAEMIAKKHDTMFFLVGSKEEYEHIENIFVTANIKYLNIAGKFSLFDTAAIIKMADLYVGNDSGLGHLSASAGQETVIILGMSDYERVHPIGKRVKVVKRNMECSPCIKKDRRLFLSCSHRSCLSLISPEEVINVIETLK